jgi:hypothetical protein
LQKAQPRPPCGPRIYKKLYAYLDKALPTETVSNRNTPTATPTKPNRTRDVYATPTKRGVAANPVTTPVTRPQTGGLQFPQLGTPKAAQAADNLNDEGIPNWIGPTIRHVCKKLDIVTCVPHVYVGVASVLKTTASATDATPSKAAGRTPRTGRSVLDAATAGRAAAEHDTAVKIPALIIAVMIAVTKRMYNRDDKIDVRAVAHELTALGKVASKRLREIVMECERLDEDEKEKWTQMDWWASVPEGTEEEEAEDVDMMDVDDEAKDELDHGQEVEAHPVPISIPTNTAQRPPPITKAASLSKSQASEKQPPPHEPTTSSTSAPMIQATQRPPRRARPKSTTTLSASHTAPTGLGYIDWLSDARRADYKVWEAQILKQIAALERAEGSERTQITPARAGRKRKADVLEVA